MFFILNGVKNHNITIPAATYNPLTEHSIEILDRLPQDKFIGRAGCCIPANILNIFFLLKVNFHLINGTFRKGV